MGSVGWEDARAGETEALKSRTASDSVGTNEHKLSGSWHAASLRLGWKRTSKPAARRNGTVGEKMRFIGQYFEEFEENG